MSIAIVEDDPDDRLFISIALQDRGRNVEVLMYQSGSEFLKTLFQSQEQPPQLVVTDLRMPVVTGFDVIKRVRAEAKFREIPVIVLSTSGNADDIEHAMKLGASAYYVKPYSVEEYGDITDKIITDYFKVQYPSF